MANLLVLFPESQHSSALAYQALVNAYYAEHFEPGSAFTYLRPDYYGNWVCAYYGPPFVSALNTVLEETPEMVVARADGVLAERTIWPGDFDE